MSKINVKNIIKQYIINYLFDDSIIYEKSKWVVLYQIIEINIIKNCVID